MKRFLTALTAVLLLTVLWGAGNGLEELRGLVLTHAKLPVFNKQTLQMMIFCDRAERQAKTMVGSDVVIDLIRRGADIDSIRDGWGLKPYPLDAKLPAVFEFWMARLHSDGIITTSKADVDQEARMAYGEDPVFFRSPLLDLNGIGFEADLGKRTVLVKSDVNIVLRMQTSDPRRFKPGEKPPEKYDFVRATSDSMRIDMTNNQILLVGSVVVDEERSVLNCDRLTIFLNRKDDAELKAANDKGELDSSGMGSVSRVLCDGNVVVTRKQSAKEVEEHGKQQVFADHLVYDLTSGTVTMTGDKKVPEVRRGRESMSGDILTLHREEQRAVISKNSRITVIRPPEKPGDKENLITVTSDNAQFDYRKNYGDFLGNVTVDDPRMQLKCARMRIDLKENSGKQAKPSKEAVSTLSGIPSLDTGGGRELDRISCFGGVDVFRRDERGKLLPGEHGSSQTAVFDQMTGIITMTGDQPTLARNDDSLSGDELRIWVNEERVGSRGGSRIALAPRGLKQSAAEKSETVILSDSSDLNYGGNLLTFNDKVKVTDPRLKVDCDKMEIFLQEKPGTAGKAKKENVGLPDLEQGGSRTLSKVVCSGNVRAVDPGSTLRSDRLTLHFRPQRAGAAPGLFQSDGTELARIEADGHFELVNTPAPGDKAKPGPAGFDKELGGLMKSGSAGPRTITSDRGTVDFVKNISEFHGHVFVRDPENSLKCDDMFLYAAKPAPVPPPGAPAKAAGIDDDPFAIADAAAVPTRINLTDTLDLTRILCKNNVFFSRRNTDGKVQKAGGDQADYVVADRIMNVTGKPGEQPWMSAEGRRMYADKIIVNTEDETMKAVGNTRTVVEK